MNRYFLSKIKYELKLSRFKSVWRKKNSHNFTVPANIFDLSSVIVGKYSYGELYVKNFGYKDSQLIIGNYCSIAEGSVFLLAGEHQFNSVTSYPFKKYILNSTNCESLSKGNIKICDDVWIGERCIILSGITIGQGAVIGAGSIVTKDIPPYAVYAGTHIIKYRFASDVINQMTKFDFTNLTKEEFESIAMFDDIISFLNSDIYIKHSLR